MNKYEKNKYLKNKTKWQRRYIKCHWFYKIFFKYWMMECSNCRYFARTPFYSNNPEKYLL